MRWPLGVKPRYNAHDMVCKTGGDYRFYGKVRAVFLKNSGALRYVVENEDGMLFIFSEAQLEPWEK